ncbi:hypothetical protein PRIPAC_74209 [Pristionchus pacificus]|uniref:Uncharacterized protein n=1 Tax=Pristionchus pacificus TaxID=54126 RepID=A0A2A6C1U5_PRIPA|nr:hypothetical protein PRIPAC_74209 [Pristionchus pacificus]|eukprot:PDM72079.1 hypothetical protein PRIPAC_38486 [Pristionchus pacificus]
MSNNQSQVSKSVNDIIDNIFNTRSTEVFIFALLQSDRDLKEDEIRISIRVERNRRRDLLTWTIRMMSAMTKIGGFVCKIDTVQTIKTFFINKFLE